jgi:hypothetical protein
MWLGMADGRAGVHRDFRTITLVLYIRSLPILATWFSCIVFNATFNNISAISWWSILLVEETRGPGENHRLVASHWQTLSHNVVHLVLIEIRRNQLPHFYLLTERYDRQYFVYFFVNFQNSLKFGCVK